MLILAVNRNQRNGQKSYCCMGIQIYMRHQGLSFHPTIKSSPNIEIFGSYTMQSTKGY